MRQALFFLLLLIVIFGGAIYLKGSQMLDAIIPDSKIIKALGNEGRAPELTGLDGWINSEPHTLKELRGKVVLVDFWTYTCINCIRTFPHITEWYKKYKDKGFVLLGIHSPEFEFEKKRANVEAAVAKYSLPYPVALDNDHDTWNAFQNRFWPAHYLIDVEGNIRYHHFGEGKYAETESAIQQLLLEANLISIDDVIEANEPPAGVDFKKIGTPEIYLGYLRINNLGNKDKNIQPNAAYNFSKPEKIEENRFYFEGNWNIRPEYAEFVGGTGKITIRYKANKLNLVLAAAGDKEVQVEIKVDGEYLDESNRGKDVTIKDGKSILIITLSEFYNLVDTGDNYEWHTFEIIVNSPGLQAFAFSFG